MADGVSSRLKVINLIGGPSSGKSTSAAGSFAEMKCRGYNVELVTEYAKDVVWQENFRVLENQIKILGEQYNRIFRLRNKVDIVVTDSPLILGLMYARGLNHLEPLIMELFNQFDNTNVFIRRVKPYNTAGRTQNESEARQKDVETIDILNRLQLPYLVIDGDRGAFNALADIAGVLLRTDTTRGDL